MIIPFSSPTEATLGEKLAMPHDCSMAQLVKILSDIDAGKVASMQSWDRSESTDHKQIIVDGG